MANTDVDALRVAGVPVLGGGGSGMVPFSTGSYFFVDSVNGNNGNSGKSATKSLATLKQALTFATAAKGDVIILMPGHAETISSATALTISISGVTIVGIGAGGLRPTFTLDTATTATINATAANIKIVNCVFVANFAAIVACFTLTTATDFQLVDCDFRDTTSVLNFVNIIDTDATSNHADGLTLIRWKRIGAGATTNTTVIKMDGTNNRVIATDGYCSHAAVTGGGFMIIATGKVVTNLECRRNTFNLTGASSLTTGMLITTDGTTNSGVLSDNYNQNLDVTTEILVTASSGFVFFNNYSSSVADKSGYLLPAADS